MQIEPGFTIGHEYVGDGGRGGRRRDPGRACGDRVLGTYRTACGHCFFCRRGDFHKCDEARVFGHGTTLGDLQGAQAEQLLVPARDLDLRKVPEGMSDEVALFAGDVMGTGYHAIDSRPRLEPGRPSPFSASARWASARSRRRRRRVPREVIAIDTVEDRLAMAESFGAPRSTSPRRTRAPR